MLEYKLYSFFVVQVYQYLKIFPSVFCPYTCFSLSFLFSSLKNIKYNFSSYFQEVLLKSKAMLLSLVLNSDHRWSHYKYVKLWRSKVIYFLKKFLQNYQSFFCFILFFEEKLLFHFNLISYSLKTNLEQQIIQHILYIDHYILP